VRARSATWRAAHWYAEKFDFRVFPIKPGTKRPHPRFVGHGHKQATNAHEQIDKWWELEPDCGIGLACSASGLVVLDADLYKSDCGFRALERDLGELPETPRQLTPQGGVHYLFRDEVGGGYSNPCTGAEAKHQGYILLAPSGHPNGGTYRWDLGAHPLETPIATLPDRWLAHLTTARGKTLAPALPSSGLDAADSWLGHAFAAEGWLGDPMPDGKRMVRCPWLAEHSDGRGDGRDSSTVLFPRAEGRTLGSFFCAHSHCAGRSWQSVLAVLSPRAKWSADQAMRAERNRLVLAHVARLADQGWDR
jgi:hypothetical protein